MKWSGVQKRIEETFAKGVKGRVRFHTTAYGNCSCGRGWITIDKREIADLGTLKAGIKYRALYHETTSEPYCAKHPAVRAEERTPGKTAEDGEFSRFDLHHAAWDYLHNSLAHSLSSANPLIRALAVLNAKVGKNKLKKLIQSDEHPLVRTLASFRWSTETPLIPNAEAGY